MTLPLSSLNVGNFAEGQVSTAFSSGTTSLTLQSGHGARFPASGFRATLWNSTDYANPQAAAAAGSAELLEVTTRSTDTLTVVRGLENTLPFNAIGGKSYTLTLSLSKDQYENVNLRLVNVRAYGATGDGVTNDTSSIVAAYSAIPSTGGTLYFPPGTYLLTQSNLNILKSNVTITGFGATLKGAPGAYGGMHLIQIQDCTDFRLHGLTLDGDMSHSGPAFNGVHTATTQAHLLNFSNVTRAWVFDSFLLNSPGDGVCLDYSGSPGSTTYNTDINIFDCELSGAYRNGISATAGYRVRISGCGILNWNTCGVDVEPDAAGSPTVSQYITIEDNFLKPCATLLNSQQSDRKSAIQVQYGDLTTPSPYASYAHIKIADNSIEGLTDSGAKKPTWGILVRNFQATIIIGNEVSGCGGGITNSNGAISASNGSVVNSNIVRYSTFGFELHRNTSFNGNLAEFNDGWGFRLARDKVTGSSNIARSNGQKAGGSSFPWGFWLEYDDYNLSNNIAFDDQSPQTQVYGAYLPDGAVSGVLTHNDFRLNLTAAIRRPASLSTSLVIKDNLGDTIDDTAYTLLRCRSTSQAVIGNGATSINLALGYNVRLTLTNSAVLTLTNPREGERYLFKIAQGGAGTYTVTWPTVKWKGGTAPVITTGVGIISQIVLFYDNATYTGEYALNYF